MGWVFGIKAFTQKWTRTGCAETGAVNRSTPFHTKNQRQGPAARQHSASYLIPPVSRLVNREYIMHESYKKLQSIVSACAPHSLRFYKCQSYKYLASL